MENKISVLQSRQAQHSGWDMAFNPRQRKVDLHEFRPAWSNCRAVRGTSGDPVSKVSYPGWGLWEGDVFLITGNLSSPCFVLEVEAVAPYAHKA